ncbi:hypothetical protein Acr_11g0001790 [Actinidia rufa]|uniref:Secreted protein n=1 Tax=Actinidia rufa TaxID=165716 RepID=A0A7J0FB92_9ERIC|nr:hypothetical protein Acr_11g0001790 [Actinidia rufa]
MLVLIRLAVLFVHRIHSSVVEGCELATPIVLKSGYVDTDLPWPWLDSCNRFRSGRAPSGKGSMVPCGKEMKDLIGCETEGLGGCCLFDIQSLPSFCWPFLSVETG